MRRLFTLVVFIVLVCNSLRAQYTGGTGNGFARSGTVQSSLPLTILSFTAQTTDGAVELHWATADERDTDFFTLERSADGTSFRSVGSLPAAGDARGRRLTYTFTDEVPLAGVSYYRLRVVDFDGSLTLSSVISVSRDATPTPSFSIYPNPTNGLSPTLSVSGSGAEGETRVVVYDLRGRQIFRFDLPGTGGPAPLPPLARGSYRIVTEVGDLHLSKLLLVTD